MEKVQELVIIFGPPAVGKSTVAKMLHQVLGYKYYHNHMVAKLVNQFFNPSDTSYWPLLSQIRNKLLESIAASYSRGFVFTYIWDFNSESDFQFINNIVNMFEEKLWKINFVELNASLGTRMRRNRGEDRIKEKPDKSDFDTSEAEIMEFEDMTLNSSDNFPYPDRHLKINSSNLSAEETIQMIIDHYNLEK